jgi:hypothetical protein
MNALGKTPLILGATFAATACAFEYLGYGDALMVSFIGLIAGFMVCSKVVLFVAVLLKERRSAIASNQSRAPLYAALAMHSGPWLLLGAIVLLVLFARASNPPAWSYTLLLGSCLGPVFYAALVTWAFLRVKAKRARNTHA